MGQLNSPTRMAIGKLVKATFGLFLFGIPHRGLILDDLRQMLGSDNPRHKLLKDLEPDSDFLTSQRKKFVNILDTQRIKVVSYHEKHETGRLESVRSETAFL